MEKIIINFKQQSYSVFILNSMFDDCSYFSSLKYGDIVFLLTDDNIAPLYLSNIVFVLTKCGFIIDSLILPHGECYKSLETLDNIFTKLLSKGYGRNITLMALGGGVIGDLTGFAASVYQRGVRFFQIPTTLLSQVDASIGGKTAVNHRLGKNMIGSFYQPSSVIIILDFLNTLSRREFVSGLAEVIKYGVILDAVFFSWLEKNLDDLLSLKADVVTYCVRRCCELKASVVTLDEYDRSGIRSLLNFGHTYGHAIESFFSYDGTWLHGEAISVGMIMAINTSLILNKFSNVEANRVKSLLLRAGLPVVGPLNMSFKDYLFYMMLDKKVVSDKLSLVLPLSIGTAKLFSNIDHDIVKVAIEGCVF